eukprot:TRINITY_DN8426_c0_g1_i2.p1 TRINITY_DN8426_c0_g1~~TRINITY_DN8426_c0_g1_i2.p1  ORF type:complete len:210 (+),score=58.43 TRINITY_DN8426_c0_g1_i2:325-954(+)
MDSSALGYGSGDEGFDYETRARPAQAAIRDAYPTLVDIFKKVPQEIGFNIEIKYPEDHVRDLQGLQVIERNQFVDAILNVVFDKAEPHRPIMFSSFDPDVCAMLRLKQPRYPVFFLTAAGTDRKVDPRRNSIQQAVAVAKSAHLMGIVSHAAPLLRAPQLITAIKKAGLILCTYGVENNIGENADLQERLAVDAVISDHVAYVSKYLQS